MKTSGRSKVDWRRQVRVVKGKDHGFKKKRSVKDKKKRKRE
jgi:hypothetical protein